MASDAASDSESDSASASSGNSLQLVSPLVSVEDLRHPDRWMRQGNPGETRESYPSAYRNSLNNMGMATEPFLDHYGARESSAW